MLNDLDRKILKIVSEEAKPISSKELALLCNASVNTVRKEIGIINGIVEHYGFRNEARRSSGHSLIMFDRERAVPYIERLRYLHK